MEALDDEYLLHDFVVIFRLVLKLLKFSDIFELFDQIVSEAMPDHLCELLEVHEDEDLGETEESKHINQGCIFWLQDTLHGTDQWPSKDSQQVKDESTPHVVHHDLVEVDYVLTWVSRVPIHHEKVNYHVNYEEYLHHEIQTFDVLVFGLAKTGKEGSKVRGQHRENDDKHI